MKKVIMYFYNLKHEIYKKEEIEYNPKTSKEGIEHFCGFYVKTVIVSIKRPQKYALYTPQHVCNKQKKRIFFDNKKVLL